MWYILMVTHKCLRCGDSPAKKSHKKHQGHRGHRGKKRQNTTPEKPDRTWRARSQIFRKCDVQAMPDKNNRNYYLLSFLPKKDENGKHVKDFQLFPKWEITFQGRKIGNDQIQFLNHLKDTLLEYTPNIRFECGKCPKGKPKGHPCDNKKPTKIFAKGKIVWFSGTESDDSLYEKYKRSHYFHLMVEMNAGDTLPETLTNFRLRIASRLLPPPRYEYGFCNPITGNYHKCSDFSYLQYPSGFNVYSGAKYCAVFDNSKGSPGTYCNFKDGN